MKKTNSFNFGRILNRIICTAIVAVTGALPAFTGLAAGQTADGPGPFPEAYGSWFNWIIAAAFVLINIFPSLYNRRLLKRQLRILADGVELLTIFMIAPFITILLIIADLYTSELSSGDAFDTAAHILLYVLTAVIVYVIVFWNGIIRVYISSVQLGIRYRIWGIILGWIFPANLVMLSKIIRVTRNEVCTENDRIILNRARADQKICKTKYPILMVHGVFFRDSESGFLNYWGRIPAELEANGAVVYFGNQQSAASVARCGEELADRIRQITSETGCEKLNIIAHSKGGLDSRYAVSKCGVSDLVASITTINTPHRGCEFADYLLNKIPDNVQRKVATAYNKSLLRLGDHDPDFMEAVEDLTYAACQKMNPEVPDVENVYYQSFGSHMKKAHGGRFPLNYSFYLVKHFDGPNDGLVGEKSFAWGERYEYLEPRGDRGISHGDMIDLNRENFDGFDVREFYVQLVSELREKGF